MPFTLFTVKVNTVPVPYTGFEPAEVKQRSDSRNALSNSLGSRVWYQGPTLTLVRLPGASASVKNTISGKLMADLKSPNGQANIPTYLCSKYCQLDHCAKLVALSTTRGNIDKSQAKY